MHDFVSKKIPNGKLLKLRVDFGKKINSITISGDFFIHPEEGIDLIEEALKGTPKYELSINPFCGMGTYIFKDGDNI